MVSDQRIDRAFAAEGVWCRALLVPVIIFGGILFGATTVTEASASGAVNALAIGALGARILTSPQHVQQGTVIRSEVTV